MANPDEEFRTDIGAVERTYESLGPEQLAKEQSLKNLYHLVNMLKTSDEFSDFSLILEAIYINLKNSGVFSGSLPIQEMLVKLKDYKHMKQLNVIGLILGYYCLNKDKTEIDITRFPKDQAKDIPAYLRNQRTSNINLDKIVYKNQQSTKADVLRYARFWIGLYKKT